MRLLSIVTIWLFLAGVPLVWGANAPLTAEAPAPHHPAEAHEGIPQAAGEVGHLGPLPITNSMVVTWVVALALIVLAQLATRNMKPVPEGAQNFWEWMVES